MSKIHVFVIPKGDQSKEVYVGQVSQEAAEALVADVVGFHKSATPIGGFYGDAELGISLKFADFTMIRVASG